MIEVYLGIGSNTGREQNIRSAVRDLRRLFGDLTVSPSMKVMQ